MSINLTDKYFISVSLLYLRFKRRPVVHHALICITLHVSFLKRDRYHQFKTLTYIFSAIRDSFSCSQVQCIKSLSWSPGISKYVSVIQLVRQSTCNYIRPRPMTWYQVKEFFIHQYYSVYLEHCWKKWNEIIFLCMVKQVWIIWKRLVTVSTKWIYNSAKRWTACIN